MITLHRFKFLVRGPCVACGRPTSRWFCFTTARGGLHAHCIFKESR